MVKSFSYYNIHLMQNQCSVSCVLNDLSLIQIEVYLISNIRNPSDV